VPGLIQAVSRDPELARRFTEKFVEPERHWVGEILDRPSSAASSAGHLAWTSSMPCC
jgi:hypothetical protein